MADSDIIFHKDKVRPCPICGKGWCSSLADGTLAFCRRVPSDKTTKTGAYIHVLRADADAPRPPPLPPPPPSVAARLFSASSYMARLDNVRERYDLDGLALNLGVSEDALERLGTRYDVFSKAYAFPMRDGGGNTVGIRLRDLDGNKRAVTHSKAGLFYDLAVDKTMASMLSYAPKLGRALFVCEGPTDTAAAMTLGFPTAGRPSCLGNHDDVRTLARRIRAERLVVIADNDEAKRRPDGSVWYPGKEGARAMVAALDMPHKMLVTPPKDMRKWVCAGATRRDVLERLELMDWR